MNKHPTVQNQSFQPIFLRIIVYGVIIPFMAAIALPNACGCGDTEKSRESEAKSILGAINRDQIAYYTEYEQFSPTMETLDISVGSPKYYHFEILQDNFKGVTIAKGINNRKNGTRDYIVGISYNPKTKTFTSTVCRASETKPDYQIIVPSEAIINYGVVREGDVECSKGVKAVK